MDPAAMVDATPSDVLAAKKRGRPKKLAADMTPSEWKIETVKRAGRRRAAQG